MVRRGEYKTGGILLREWWCGRLVERQSVYSVFAISRYVRGLFVDGGVGSVAWLSFFPFRSEQRDCWLVGLII